VATFFGARILCVVCGARPYPDEPGVRETFDLLRIGPDGKPSESPKPWYCEEHRPR
jgi:hypothetical protein